MAPKRKAASKPKKTEQIIEDTVMSNITRRRPIKNNKDEREGISSPKESVAENFQLMNATMVIEKVPNTLLARPIMSDSESEEFIVCEESDIKSVLKKKTLTKVNKSELNKQAFEDDQVSKKPRKRAVSEDRTNKVKEDDTQTIKMEEKVVSSKSKKRPVGKEPSGSHEPQKRNRRAASVDILTKNAEPKKIRKGTTVETSEVLANKHGRSSSLDEPTKKPPTASLAEAPKKNRKANKAVVETIDDKPPKNTKASDKKEPKVLEKTKKVGKNTKKTISDVKEKVTEEISDVLLDIEEDIETPKLVISRGRGKKEDIKSPPEEFTVEQDKKNIRSRGKRQVVQNLVIYSDKSSEEEFCEKYDSETVINTEIKSKPNKKEQLDEFTVEQDKKNIRSRGKRQVVQNLVIYSDKSSEEEFCEKYDSETVINTEIKSKPNKKEQLDGPPEEQDLKLVEESSENIPKQINSKTRGGKRQAIQKGISKSSEEFSGKSNTDDSDMAKSPEKKPKRNAKQKESNTDQETKLLKRKGRKFKKDDFEEKVTSDNDVNVKTGDVPTDILADSPESGKNVPVVVKRKAKAKPAKK